MKNLKLLLIGFTLLACIASCTKEGPAGPAGANGTDGNANVIVINHGADSLTNVREVIVTTSSAVTTAELDSSLVLVYYQGSLSQGCNNWYSSPGLGCGGDYQTRWYYNSSNGAIIMSARDADGSAYSGSVVRIDRVKVVIAKGTAFFSGKKEIDFNDYLQVKAAFGLKD